eukprot:11074747-Lingulodinium_polyedra.AAC.1
MAYRGPRWAPPPRVAGVEQATASWLEDRCGSCGSRVRRLALRSEARAGDEVAVPQGGEGLVCG